VKQDVFEGFLALQGRFDGDGQGIDDFALPHIILKPLRTKGLDLRRFIDIQTVLVHDTGGTGAMEF
jgi:hypothetical protein